MADQFTTLGITAAIAGGLTSTKFPYVAFGTGSATFALGLTAMGSESVRVATLDTIAAGCLAAQRAYLQNTQGVATLTEIGLWDASSNGNLLMYKLFNKSLVKTDDDDALFNCIAAIRNTKVNTACLTFEGLKAFRAGGVTASTFPYMSVHGETVDFAPTLLTLGTELARAGTLTVTPGATSVTIAKTFGAGSGTGTWKSIALWDASSGGNLLAAINCTSTVKGAGDSKTATITLTVANES